MAQAAAFEELVTSVSFSRREEPEWKLPAGWASAPGGEMRFATLKIEGTKPPLEVAVSTLTAPDPTTDAYLRMNVERWRGQVGLAEYSGADWRGAARQSGELREVPSSAGPVYVVKLTGKDPQSGEPAAILAAMIPHAGTAAPNSSIPASAGGAMDLPLTYSAPPEWETTPAGPMQMLRFAVADGGQKAEVSVSAAGGNLEMNIARWRGQVKLPEASPAQLAAALQPIDVDGAPAHYAEIVGEKETILGAIVPRAGTNLFFKLRGDKELAARERERFREFLKSVHFTE